MAAENDDVVLAPTCKYVCDGDEWVLIEGTAPPGYYCPDILGGCLDIEDTVEVEPIPIESEPGTIGLALRSTAAVDSGEYSYHRATNTLYFSNGAASKGFRLLTKISSTELLERFPVLAAEVELLKNSKSLIGFSVEVPAVPIVKRQKPAS